MSSITILGLGPGDAADLTRAAWVALEQADVLYLRTAHHPTVAALPPHLRLHTFDSLYDTASDFASVYEQIVNQLLERAQAGEDVLYAVPGHPLVAEATTRHVLHKARELGIAAKVIAGLSFIEPVCTALGVDPLEHGMQLIDALDLIAPDEISTPGKDGAWSEIQGLGPYLPPVHPFPVVPTKPVLLCQIYNRNVASQAKITLMERYPADHPVRVVRAAGVPGEEQVWTVPLYELDHQNELDHLSCAYLPALEPLADRRGIDGLVAVFNRLLGPKGCPWDRDQTHQSLRSALLEETHEVLEAIDAGDMDALSEEMGDLLGNIIAHSEMARQAGDFDLGNVFEGITSKLIRRHPHIFGEASANTASDVNRTWDAIKQSERESEGLEPRGALDGIPVSLPALTTAQTITRKAAKRGFDWPDIAGAWGKVEEELGELREASTNSHTPAEIEAELGDVLFAISNLARWLNVDAESALRVTAAKFRRRFASIERYAQTQGLQVHELTLEQQLAQWHAAKQAEQQAEV